MKGSDPLTGAVLRRIDTTKAGGTTLVFDAGRLAIATPFTLRCDSGGTVDPQAVIGCCVTAAYTTGDRRVWVFDGHVVLAIALRAHDSAGGPAAVFQPDTGPRVVFR